MIRTQLYLTERERKGLTELAKATGKKQSELIREAVDWLIGQFSVERREEVLSRAAGMWKDRDDLPDFRGLRADWDRE